MSRVLVIEDEESIRENVRDLLEAEGFDVVTADDGVAGVAAAFEDRPDLILCDIMMPGLDGYEVLEQVRANPDLGLTPFVFLTALADRSDVRKGMSVGADDFVTKPFASEELLSAVRARLGRQERVGDKLQAEMRTLRDSMSLALPHELRTPLTAIVAGAALLESRVDQLGADDLRRLAELMRVSAERLERLIENYLLFAELEGVASPARGGGSLGWGSPEAATTVHEAVARVAALHGRSDDLAVDMEPASLRMSGEHLAKMATELADNAFKFSEPGEAVRVEGRRDPDGYAIVFADGGCGMVADQIARVGAFMQFGRDEREQQGSGLGLTIARRLAEAHGGLVRIESAPGTGTTVTVCRLELDAGDEQADGGRL